MPGQTAVYLLAVLLSGVSPVRLQVDQGDWALSLTLFRSEEQRAIGRASYEMVSN